jgi:hypothetical protein
MNTTIGRLTGGINVISQKSFAGLGAGVILALGFGAVAGTGVASATPEDYLYDINNNGIGGPNGTLLSLGYGACTNSQSGVPSAQSIAAISNSTQLGASDAQFLYDSALMFLC